MTRTRANVLNYTRANIDEYRTRANVFISDQGQRFWIFLKNPIYRTRANTPNENIGLGPILWPRVHSRFKIQVGHSNCSSINSDYKWILTLFYLFNLSKYLTRVHSRFKIWISSSIESIQGLNFRLIIQYMYLHLTLKNLRQNTY